MPKQCRPFGAQQIHVRGAGVIWARHRKAFSTDRDAGLGTHHLLQLVLDLPVHLCHLEEHIPCRDRTERV